MGLPPVLVLALRGFSEVLIQLKKKEKKRCSRPWHLRGFSEVLIPEKERKKEKSAGAREVTTFVGVWTSVSVRPLDADQCACLAINACTRCGASMHVLVAA